MLATTCPNKNIGASDQFRVWVNASVMHIMNYLHFIANWY